MPRKANGRGKIRADLEGILLALADIDECAPLLRLRINQAIRRTGLTALLVPALDDLMRMVNDVADARAQVLSAVQRLME